MCSTWSHVCVYIVNLKYTPFMQEIHTGMKSAWFASNKLRLRFAADFSGLSSEDSAAVQRDLAPERENSRLASISCAGKHEELARALDWDIVFLVGPNRASWTSK